MVLCRFYQQGYCRFGNNCRFEHTGNTRQLFAQPPANNNYYGSSDAYSSRNVVGQSNYDASTPGNNSFGAPSVTVDNRAKNYGTQSNTNISGPTFTDFVNSVVQELEIGIKGNQWPFSCFGPQKEGDNWPGLEDMSPEELRLEAYNCQREGRSLDAYIRGVELMKNSQMAKNNELKSRTPAVLELMRKLFQGQKLGDVGSFSAPFGQSGSGGGASQFRFALDQQTFGNNSPQQAVAAPVSQFGQAPAIFGQPSSTNAWPATQTFGSAVASPASNAPVASSFGHPIQPLPATQTNIFGQGAAQQQPSFGSTSVFQVLQTAPNRSNSSSTVASHTGTTYTPINVLTDDEKQQFSALTFTLGKIPIRPPAIEYC